MASPLCSVNGSSEHIAHATTYGATVNLALLSTLGVNAVDFVVVGVSNSTLTIPTITEGTLGTASFTFPADPSDAMGRSVLVEIIVNGGFDQHGKQSPALRTRVLIGVANANGVIPIASDESMERDAIVGWLAALNEILASTGEGAVTPLVTASASGKVNLFPSASRRILHSDGSTGGGTWAVLSKTDLDSALADNSVGLPKLHSGSATDEQILSYDTTTAVWRPRNERVTTLTQSGIAVVTNTSGDVWQVHVPAPSYPSVPTYVAGAGMTADGTTFNVIGGDDSLSVSADAIVVNYSNTLPSANGVAAHGTDVHPARIDHVHPAGVDSNMIVRYEPVIGIVYDMTISAPGRPIEGLYTGARFWYQNGGSVNDGIYIWNGAAVPATRATDMPNGAVLDLSKTHLIPVSRVQESGQEGSFIFSTATGTVTVGTNSTSWSIVGQDPNGITLVHHVPCLYASTRDIPDIDDFANDGTFFDGFTLSEGMRVLLAKQTTDPTQRGLYHAHHGTTWGLLRTDDLDMGVVLRSYSSVVHRVDVLYGNLWGGPTRWAFWGGTVGAAAIDGGVFSLVNLDGINVFDGTVAASETATTLVSSPISGEEKIELRVLGKVTIDDDSYNAWADEYYAWEVYDSSALNGAPGTDESGKGWAQRSTGTSARTYLESTDSFPDGNDSSWRVWASSDIYTKAYVWLSHTLPIGYRYRARVKGVTGSGQAEIAVNSNFSNPGGGISVPVAGWETVVTTGEFDVTSTTYLNLYAQEVVIGNTSCYGFFAHLQVDRRRIYVEPVNNIVLDLQKTWQGTDWDISTSGYANHITVSATAGTVVAEAKPYDRNVRLSVKFQRCSIPDSTTVTYETVADDLGYNF